MVLHIQFICTQGCGITSTRKQEENGCNWLIRAYFLKPFLNWCFAFRFSANELELVHRIKFKVTLVGFVNTGYLQRYYLKLADPIGKSISFQ